MDTISSFTHWLEPRVLIETFRYAGLFAIVFAESGLLIGFFFPGDSLLLIAGVLAAGGILDIKILIPIVFTAAFLGDQVGYWTGNKLGRKLFNREDSRLFHKQHVVKSEEFFAKYGHKTIILARFVPIVRTFAPILAGVGNMAYGTFVIYNLIGAVLWGIGVTLLGYWLGNIPYVERYLNYVIIAIIIISLLPVLNHIRKKS